VKLYKALCLVVFFTATGVLAMGKRDKKVEPPPTVPVNDTVPESAGQEVRVSGRVRLVGSGVFPELVISGVDREWYIEKEDEKALWDFQQQAITVEGTETYRDQTFANGVSAGRRYSLKNIKIIGISGGE
jgi:hypothetical protein